MEISSHPKLFSSITSDHETMFFRREDVITTIKKSSQEESARFHELATVVGLEEISRANAIYGALICSRKPEILPQNIDQIQGSTTMDDEILKNFLIDRKLLIRKELRAFPSCLGGIYDFEIRFVSIPDEIRNRINLLEHAEEQRSSELTISRMCDSKLAIYGRW